MSVARGHWPDRVAFTDAQGTSQFDVAGSSFEETLSLRAPGGHELAVVRRHGPTGGFEAVAGGRQLALARRRWFSLFSLAFVAIEDH